MPPSLAAVRLTPSVCEVFDDAISAIANVIGRPGRPRTPGNQTARGGDSKSAIERLRRERDELQEKMNTIAGMLERERRSLGDMLSAARGAVDQAMRAKQEAEAAPCLPLMGALPRVLVLIQLASRPSSHWSARRDHRLWRRGPPQTSKQRSGTTPSPRRMRHFRTAVHIETARWTKGAVTRLWQALRGRLALLQRCFGLQVALDIDTQRQQAWGLKLGFFVAWAAVTILACRSDGR